MSVYKPKVLYALKIPGPTPELDLFWVESRGDKPSDVSGEFEARRPQGPTPLASKEDVEFSLSIACGPYSVESVEVVDWYDCV